MNIDEIKTKIPIELQSAFNKAINWQPKSAGFGLSLNAGFKKVLSGKKPVYYGGRPDVMRQYAKQYGLDINANGSCAYLPENADLARLIDWADSLPGNSKLKHATIGLALGYPIDAVANFSDNERFD